MSETVDIGAARIRLIVDAADFDPIVAQGKSAITGFGAVAQQAYNNTEKATRRAADSLLDYVNSLGRADTTMDRFIRNASRLGVEKPVLDAAIDAWAKHNAEVEDAVEAQADHEAAVRRSQAAYKDLISTQQAEVKQLRDIANAQAATRIDNLASARAANSQNSINALVAPGLAIDPQTQQHRLDAEAAFSAVIEAENALIEAQQALEAQSLSDHAEHVRVVQAAYKELIATQQAEERQLQANANAAASERIDNLASARAATVQQSINALVAPGLAIDPQTQQHRLDAESAFAEIVEKENAAFATQEQLIDAIAAARADQTASNSQQSVNQLVAPGLLTSDIELRERRNAAQAAFLPMLEEEAKLEQENAQLVNRQQAFLQELENIQSTAGKTYYEMLELRAAQVGLSESAAPLIANIKAANTAMGNNTISAKQYEFALRGLPAQFTDIVVSLQAGQRPLTVLLQQGGQIKDMFGGVGNAVRVVASEVAKLALNPWILLAGAIAAVGAAAISAQTDIDKLAISTAKGDQVAGSASSLNDLADSLAKIDHTSIGNAQGAVEALAAAGRLTGDNFDRAAQASARWASITGESVDEVAGKFNQLAADPMAAVLDGTLRVTDAQYQQLAALAKIGDKAAEVQLAVKLYQQQLNDNSDKVLAALSDSEKGWISLKNAISDAAHELGEFSKSALGSAFNHLKAPTLHDFATAGLGGDQAISIGGDDEPLFGAQGAAPVTRSGFGGVGTDAAAQSAIKETTKLTLDQVSANQKLQEAWDALGTKPQLYAQAVLKLNATLKQSSPDALSAKGITANGDGTFGGAGYAKLLEGERLKIFGQGPEQTKAIEEWQKTALATLKTVQDAQQAGYQNGLLNAEQYYETLQGIAKAEEIIELQAIDKEIAALQGRANSEDKIAALRQQRQTVAANYEASHTKLVQEETEAIKQRNLAYVNYTQQLADANIQLSRQGDQAAQAVGTGSRQNSLDVAINNAKYAEAIQERNNNEKVGNQAGYTQAEADKDNAAAAAALSTQLDILKGNYASLSAAEADWTNGSKKAWQDWAETVDNSAAEVNKVTTTAMNDFAKSIADAALKGKLSFKTFFEDIEQELVEFGAKAAEEKAIQSVLGGINGGSSASGDYGTNFSGWATALGSLIFSAKGNVFGGQTLSAYRNSIVTQPTVFPFAKGGAPNVGIMGEKSGSPGEAILPLTRTSGGELAVKATGQQERAPATINQIFVVPDSKTSQSQNQIALKTFGAAKRASARA